MARAGIIAKLKRPVPPLPTERALIDDTSDAELRRYGFTVVRLLSPAQVSDAIDFHAAIGPAPDDPAVAMNWSFHTRSEDHKRRVHDGLRRTLGEQVEGLFVDHTTFLATYIIKWPGPNSAFAPHQDPSLVDERVGRGYTVWIPLTDTGIAGPDNGLLRFVPGSHRFSTALRPSNVDVFAFAEHEQNLAENHSVGVALEAGEAVIFDNGVIHFSMPNESDAPRVAASFGIRPRNQPCVLLRPTGRDGTYDLHPIPDSFYIDVAPVDHQAHRPEAPSTGTVEIEQRRWSPKEINRLCRKTRGVPASVKRTVPPPRQLKDPDAFCAFCGAAIGEVDGRDGRNNAQMVCADCASSRS